MDQMSVETEKVLEFIEKYGEKADGHIYKDKPLAMFVINVGIDTIKSRDRRRARREIKSDINPEFEQNPNSSSVYAVRFNKETIERIQGYGDRLMEDWCIGGLVLGDLTKEELIEEAEREELSGRGHLINAKIYRALAEPLVSEQKMRSYWTKEKASEVAAASVGEQPQV
jgi:hypothetical protein